MDKGTQESRSQALGAADEVLKHVDLEKIGNYATATAAALALVRRHPWLLVVAGSALAVVGAWQISRKRDEKEAQRTKNGTLEQENGTWKSK